MEIRLKISYYYELEVYFKVKMWPKACWGGFDQDVYNQGIGSDSEYGG